MKTYFILPLLTTFLLTSCFDVESDEIKIARAEKECSEKTKVEGLSIFFYGYFKQDADSIQIQIKRKNDIVQAYKDRIPEMVEDSIRHLRHYDFNKEILLTDTLFVSVSTEPVKKIYDFKYIVRPHFSMTNHNWGCDFYQLTVDGEVEEGGTIAFTKSSWKFVDRKDFQTYYIHK